MANLDIHGSGENRRQLFSPPDSIVKIECATQLDFEIDKSLAIFLPMARNSSLSILY